MKYLLILFNFVFFILPAIAQEDTDQATIRCYYLFSQKKDNKDKEFFSRDTMTLDVGSQMSRYYDERKIREDSIFGSILSDFGDKITSLSILKNAEPNVLDHSSGNTYRNNTHDGISEQIYKDRKKGNIIMLNTSGGFPSDRYKGIDPAGRLNWTIEPDTAVFFNYLCQKANLSFRGRNYEAWFTPQIPINDGPWKFFGLPGLILKVTDTDEQFDFECIGLEYVNTPYIIKIPEYKYFECNRKDYNKVMNKKSGGMIININGGNVILANFNAGTAFQPMELE